MAFLALIAGFAACSKDEGLQVDPSQARFNVVETGSADVPAEGGVISYTVDANVRWSYELTVAGGEWIKATRNGNVLSVIVEENGASEARSAQLRFNPTNTTADLAKVFEIRQAAKSDDPAGPGDDPVTSSKKYRIIAHRGHHSDGSTAPQNSIAGLASAQALGVYGSEFDVWITTDGKLVVWHDRYYTGTSRVDDATFATLDAAVKLSNGESLPTLEDFIEQGLKNPAVKLILEVKNHASAEKNSACVNAVVKMIREKGVETLMEYISANWDVCLQLRSAFPNAPVYYVVDNSNIKTPQEVKNAGLTGMDYKYARYLDHPEYIGQAHDLGLKVNVWTINDDATFQNCLKMGFDFLTTDMPKSNKEYVDAHPELQD